MSYAIVFSSKTGNTELLADTLHSCLPQADCCYFGNPNPAAMEADTLYVGFWTDKGKADESSSDFLKQLRGKQVFLFGTPDDHPATQYQPFTGPYMPPPSAETAAYFVFPSCKVLPVGPAPMRRSPVSFASRFHVNLICFSNRRSSL